MTVKIVIIKYGYNGSLRGINTIIEFLGNNLLWNHSNLHALVLNLWCWDSNIFINRQHRVVWGHFLYILTNINTHALIQDWTQTFQTIFQKISDFLVFTSSTKHFSQTCLWTHQHYICWPYKLTCILRKQLSRLVGKNTWIFCYVCFIILWIILAWNIEIQYLM